MAKPTGIVKPFPLRGRMSDWSTALRMIIESDGLVKAGQYIKNNIPPQFWEHFKKRAVEIKNECS